MLANYWAGCITTEAMTRSGMPGWWDTWKERAEIAEARGSDLLVLEVPKTDLLLLIGGGGGSCRTAYNEGVGLSDLEVGDLVDYTLMAK